ncbi:MAG: hydrogenase formation protein HypD, partial [Planctomycetales bacterium]|nr:hydrogenase formation protein HypD [Planctomycetales bacterium]
STAVAAQTAQREGVKNFSLLVAHVLVPPALEAILASPRHRVQAVLAAGHVCSVMGHWQYGAVSERHRVPIVVTGFEPLDVLEGVRRAVLQLERGATEVENAFDRIVTQAGNEAAQAILAEVFETTDRAWRGIGVIPRSGWKLCEAYRDLDAEHRFGVCNVDAAESTRCRSGEVLQGLIKPCECAAFGKECTPSSPLGATMVSGEGACAAYYNYGRAAAPLGPNAVEASS